MTYVYIKLEKTEYSARITINRPEVLNALNLECSLEIKHALQACLEEDSIKCVVFTGEGRKSFVAGADIEELQQKSMLEMLDDGGIQEIFTYIENYAKPTIAMINGYALGGGCELAMACDIRVASEGSRFGLPELGLSIIPGAGGTQRLSRLVGSGNALYMILTGKIVKADEAKIIGLVNEVVKEEELENTVKNIVSQLNSKGPIALKLAKLSVKQGLDSNIHVGLLIEKLSQALLFSTEDKQEGMEAFLNKRAPQFKGR